MIVLEIQKNTDSAATIATYYADPAKAENKYHTILAAAAVSSVPVHSAVLMYDNGSIAKRESYMHNGAEVDE